MEILEGAMAFCVVMIVLATVVTGMTEAYLRACRRRQAMLARVMKEMIHELTGTGKAHPFAPDTVQADAPKPLLQAPQPWQVKAIWPFAEERDWPQVLVDELTLLKGADPLETLRSPAHQKISLNVLEANRKLWGVWSLGPGLQLFADLGTPVLLGAFLYAVGLMPWALAVPIVVFFWFACARHWENLADGDARLPHYHRIDNLTIKGFAERLARSNVFFVMFDTPKQKVMTEVVSRFAQYKALNAEKFRKAAQVTAIWIAIGTALAFNIDAGRLLKYVFENDQVRTDLIANAPEIAAQAEDLRSQIADLGEPGNAQEATLKEDLETKLDTAEALLQDTMALFSEDDPLPVGMDFYPHCLYVKPILDRLSGDPDTPSKDDKDAPQEDQDAPQGDEDDYCAASKDENKTFGLWAFNAVIAGALIGLGGPFWYRVFNGLSRLSSLLGRKGIKPLNSETVANDAVPQTREEEIEEAVTAAAKIWENRDRWVPSPPPETTPEMTPETTPSP